MTVRALLFWCLLPALGFAASEPALYGIPPAASGLFPGSPKRVVFLGDSITYSGQFVAYIAAYHRTRFPTQAVEIVNLGLPSETACGLSEPEHLNHGFPRPDLHERLDRVLRKAKPDLVFACYGMNDGIYLPFDGVRFEQYQRGIREMRDKILKAGAGCILVTPPVYDEARGGRNGYTEVLDRYSEWLVQQRSNKWHVIDLHKHMKEAFITRKADDPAFTFARDGVHPDSVGHWIMARAILLDMGAKDVARNESVEQMLAAYPNGAKLLQEQMSQIALWRDAWLTATGHKRPGIPAGQPMEIDPVSGVAQLIQAKRP